MREEPLMTHDQIVTKWMENPDFLKSRSLNSMLNMLI